MLGLLLLCVGQPAAAGVVAVESAERTAAAAAVASARADDRRFVLQRLVEARARLDAARRTTATELQAVEQDLLDLALSFRDLMARREEATAVLEERGERVLVLQRRIEAVLAELMQRSRAEVADRRRIAQLRAIAASYVGPFAEARQTLAKARTARRAFANEELELRAAGLDARSRQLALEQRSTELEAADRAVRLDLTTAEAQELAARRGAERAQTRHAQVLESRRSASLPAATARLASAPLFGPTASRLQPAVATARAVLDRRPARVAVLFGGPSAPAVAALSGMGRVMPVAGSVIGHFGQGPNALLDQGITIAVEERRLVRAPRGGRVAFAGPFKGFGLLLIIEHGDEYHSLLSGLSRIAVPVGAAVRTAQLVGTLEPKQGDTAQLYVELRRRGVPMNPLPWLAAGQDKVRG